MKVSFSPGFDPKLLKQVEETLPALEETLGEAKDRVTIEWSPLPNQGSTAKLQITDHEVSRADHLTGDELDRKFHVRWRLSRLWDSVLAERSRLLALRIRDDLALEGL